MFGIVLLVCAGAFGAVAFAALGVATRPNKLRHMLGAKESDAEPARLPAPRSPAFAAQHLFAVRPGAAAGAVVAVLAGWAVLGSPVAGLVTGVLVPAGSYLARRLKKESTKRAILSGLEGACTVIATALRSGRELISALEGAVRYAKPPLKEELGDVLGNVKLGKPLGDAFGDFARRWPSPETELLAFAFDLASRLGGSAVPKTILSVTTSVRERFEQEHLIRAKTTYQRISGAIVSLVPLWCIGMMRLLSPGFFTSSFSGEGRLWLLLGTLFLVAGWIAVYRSVRSEEL